MREVRRREALSPSGRCWRIRSATSVTVRPRSAITCLSRSENAVRDKTVGSARCEREDFRDLSLTILANATSLG
jgi:hypothetical protein